ncbi:MAG: RHS repeat-associated core domain-containing protein [Myxococcota bacterium]
MRGSIVASSDGSGALIAERSFFPHGAERASTGWVDELGFTGQELDESSGLLHFQKRSLDLGSGRWASVDPKFAVLDASLVQRLGEATTAYAYVANNFASAVDPDGQILFAMLTPLRKTVLPFRDRRKKDSDGGAGGGQGQADADKKPAKPLSPRKQERADRLKVATDRFNEVKATLKDIKENRQGEPGISKERRRLKQEKRHLFQVTKSLAAPPSKIRYLLRRACVGRRRRGRRDGRRHEGDRQRPLRRRRRQRRR